MAHKQSKALEADHPGTARTDVITAMVGQMVAAIERGADTDLQRFLAEPTGGRRLAAYVRLYVKPEGAYLLPLVDALVNEEQHSANAGLFGDYPGS